MKTRLTEEILTTAEPSLLLGRYTAGRVLRKWNEDFVDEDTGNVVSIERNEIIVDRGVLIDQTILGQIQFHISTGDIEAIKVSNIQREGVFSNSFPTIWVVTVQMKKNKNIYLYANGPLMALEIAKDFAEQKFPGAFHVIGLKALNGAILIDEEVEEEEDSDDSENAEINFYKMQVEITNDDFSQTSEFILRGKDVESAKKTIENYTIKRIEKNNEQIVNLQLTTISASIINCEAMADIDFCREYLDAEEVKSD